MKSEKRKISPLILLPLFFPIVSLSGCCVVSGTEKRIVDANGNGIENVWIIYGYRGYKFTPGDSISYYRPGTIVQTDKNGFFRIPSTIHWFTPLLVSGLSLEYYAVYDPGTHCAGIAPYGIYLWSDGPERFREHYWWLDVKKENGIDVLVFGDVSNDPVAWYSSIKQLEHALSMYWPICAWDAPVEQRIQLCDYFVRECNGLKDKYGSKECTYREFFIKSQYPMSYEKFKKAKFTTMTYEEYKAANDSFYKGKTWGDVISYELQLTSFYRSNLEKGRGNLENEIIRTGIRSN